LLEEEETKLVTLRKMLDDWESSDFVEYTLDGMISEIDSESH
jgi:antitoxin ParD1/3/4